MLACSAGAQINEVLESLFSEKKGVKLFGAHWWESLRERKLGRCNKSKSNLHGTSLDAKIRRGPALCPLQILPCKRGSEIGSKNSRDDWIMMKKGVITEYIKWKKKSLCWRVPLNSHAGCKASLLALLLLCPSRSIFQEDYLFDEPYTVHANKKQMPWSYSFRPWAHRQSKDCTVLFSLV